MKMLWMATSPKIQIFSSDMKRTYIMPALQVNEAEVQNIIAVSIQNGNADPSAEVLTKEDAAWEIWGDD